MKTAVQDSVPIVVDGQPTTFDRGMVRYCAIMEYDTQIIANGGKRSQFAEVGRGLSIVAVSGPQAGLDWLAGRPGFTKFPQRLPDTPLGSMTVAERAALREIAARLALSQARIDSLTASTTYRALLEGLLRRVRRVLDYDVVLGEWAYEDFDYCNFQGLKAIRTLGSLTLAQRQALRAEALAMNKTQEEIDAFISAGRNWGEITLRAVLAFIYDDFEIEPRWSVLSGIFGLTLADVRFSHVSLTEMLAQVS